jgi:hypothetical protein
VTIVESQPPDADSERRFPAHLRLAWSNPNPEAAPRAGRPRVDFALAIERHLSGADGLTRDQFLAVYSGRRSRLALAPS